MAEAIGGARDDLLLVADAVQLRFVGDPSELWIELRWQRAQIPAAELLAITVREHAPMASRETYATRDWSVEAPRWLVFELVSGRHDALGPVSLADATRLAGAFQRWRAAHPLEPEPLDVGSRYLLTEPARFHGRRVRATAEWRVGRDDSTFAGAWLEPPAGETFADGRRTARAVGTWVHRGRAHGLGGFGPGGRWRSLFLVERLEAGGDLHHDPVRLADYDRFADERPFLAAAAAYELDDRGRERYAALVAERDPERAEWLQLERGLHARAAEDPAVIARFLALAERIGTDYARLLLRDAVINCGEAYARDKGLAGRFVYNCGKRWETLAPAGSRGARACQTCGAQVHRCETLAQADELALAGEVIALPRALHDGPRSTWAERLFRREPEARVLSSRDDRGRVEVILGFARRSDGRGGSAAGFDDDTLIVAQGCSGHGTAWTAARMAVRLALAKDATCFVGAALPLPLAWGDHDPPITPSHAASLYARGVAAMSLGPERPPLEALFARVDRALATFLQPGDRCGPAGATAARLEGVTLHGAHVGSGCALLLGRGAVVHLAAPQILRLACEDRVLEVGAPLLGDRLDERGRIDTFAIELCPGDVLLLASDALPFADAKITDMVATWRTQAAALAVLAQEIARRLDEHAGSTPAVDLCFVLARPCARASAGSGEVG